MKRTAIKRVNRERRAAAFERNYGQRGGYVREMPCLLAAAGGCRDRIQAAHVKARGMGGCNGDRRSLIPLCGYHHALMGVSGIKTFSSRFSVDLPAAAQRIAEQLDAGGVP